MLVQFFFLLEQWEDSVVETSIILTTQTIVSRLGARTKKFLIRDEFEITSRTIRRDRPRLFDICIVGRHAGVRYVSK